MKMTKVFVYGTLRRGHGNHRLLTTSEYIGVAVLEGYRMVSLGGFPAIFKGEKDDVVMGEVYYVTQPVLNDLDRLEGFNRQSPSTHDLYHAVPVTVEGAERYDCETYTMDHSTREFTDYPPVPAGDWNLRDSPHPRYVYGE